MRDHMNDHVARLKRLLSSFPFVLFLSVIIRITLILYSEWHDAHSVVKYTDVDYRVFSDAARFVLGGSDSTSVSNWHTIGSPYERATYRYTPLLAILLIPNHTIHPSFGKYLFALCDIVNGLLIYQLLKHTLLQTSESQDHNNRAKKDASKPATDPEQRSALLAASHLLNPLVIGISTRGSSESVLSFWVLAALYNALHERWDLAAVFIGIGAHWKIYPAFYAISCLSIIGARASFPSEQAPMRGFRPWLCTIVNWRTVRFFVLSAGTFFSLGIVCYLIWGYPFLYESYLYHLHRLDHRHNFSPYFYLTYLTYPDVSSDLPQVLSAGQAILRSPLVSFLPQMTLTIGSGLLFGRRKQDLVLAWFVQTVVFVVFNKVCTSQYFLWYLLLLPLLIPHLHMSTRNALLCVAVWAAVQALWLAEAYKLEFLGDQVFFGVWVRGLIYVVGNSWVLCAVLDSYNVSCKMFDRLYIFVARADTTSPDRIINRAFVE